MGIGLGNGEHRTAKVIELVGSSRIGFDDAVRNALEDARGSIHGISGAHVSNFSVRCEDGQPTEWRVDLKIAFGVERTGPL
ncbi:MAG: dodecin [Thermoplasmata archaeon]|jgi:flavin-binding protein dodecin|nr:dodecin [Thermoplasmata archaeon]